MWLRIISGLLYVASVVLVAVELVVLSLVRVVPMGEHGSTLKRGPSLDIEGGRVKKEMQAAARRIDGEDWKGELEF